MEINAIKCLICGDIVFSRTSKDEQRCRCNNIVIFDGLKYTKFRHLNKDSYYCAVVNLGITKKELQKEFKEGAYKSLNLIKEEWKVQVL